MSPIPLSIVVPVLNEIASIRSVLQALEPLRARGAEVIVVDGGSQDGTAAAAKPLADVVVASARGRALQMNAGAERARGNVLLFLHADTFLPVNADELVLRAVTDGASWGRFDVSIEGRSAMLTVVAAMMNVRSRLTGVATGDQAIFVRRDAFTAIGGFPNQSLMEDVELSKRLRSHTRPACLTACVHTSGRRWEQRGVWRTIWLMWSLRWRYWRGASAEQLARDYR